MAGYHNFSMSNNAVDAYHRGLLPASKAAREFGFKSTAALRSCVRSGEWHHTSKKFNATDFFDVMEAIEDAEWRDLASWKPHLTRRGWSIIRGYIREKLREQMIPCVFYQSHHKSRYARLAELSQKYPTPYHRRNGIDAVENSLAGKQLTDAAYVEAKRVVDERREERTRRA